ncbi:AraC family transcriptional regulator [Flavobacterium notoginsengisoli]|uniref:AraC family transcriptional regulator n=1 Tax=Flavobacterium notoginsengisoli TaxID=1478199 RepID=UPI003640A128
MNRNTLLLFLLLSHLPALAQKNLSRIPDSLQNRNYDYLDKRFYQLKRDSAAASVYAYAFLQKAKNEQNSKQIVNGFQNLMLLSPGKIRIIYADSMINASKKSSDNALIGSAYLTRGTVYYGLKMHQPAMDNYLIANGYISKTKDQYLIHKVKYCIALTKLYAGFYDEAVSLLSECADYYSKEDPRPYLNSLHSLGLCYTKLGDYGKSAEINSLGISESKTRKIEEMVPYFTQSEGINEYFKKNYGTSIKNLESSIEPIRENNDFGNEAVGYFYLGKNYWSLRQKEKAVPYFELVDKIFRDKKYVRADLRQAFELLISFYKTKKDLRKQLYYIDQLLKADTVLTETNRYIIGKIHKQYDTQELLHEKERISAENESMTAELISEKRYDIIFAAVILILFLILLGANYFHKRTKRTAKKRYQALMDEFDAKITAPKTKTVKDAIKNISPDTVNFLLRELDNFEKNKRFLEKDWNLTSLSAAFNTNPKYLAIVLEDSREKGITNYINGLRIEHIITLLRKEHKLRGYTYEALAVESGFSTTERFTKAFLKKTGITPQFFIEEIKKEKI